MRLFYLAALSVVFFSKVLADPYQVINQVTSYGWLDQYSMDTRHSFVGNEACVPTSSTNGLTYLQNTSPTIFGNTLSGLTYSDWENTDDYLIFVMGTTPVVGTYYYQFVYALDAYVTQTKGYPNVQFSGMFPNNIWYPSGGYPQPSYITSGRPTIPFLTNAVASGSACLLSIEYIGGGGHELLVNGLEWDPVSQTGTLYFVDPLDPSQAYSPAVPLGPVKQTSGTLTVDNAGNLVLQYVQYAGRLPYNGSYQVVNAKLLGLLSMGGAPFIPFSLVVTDGNAHEVASGLDGADLTTSSTLSALSIMNTITFDALAAVFQQIDPSVFSGVLLSEQATMLEARKIISQNLWLYQRSDDCCNPCDECHLWVTPFGEKYDQDTHFDRLGFKSDTQGVIGGLDCIFDQQIVVGASLNWSRSKMHWHKSSAKAHIDTYGGFLYGAYFDCDYLLDISVGYFQNQIRAKRYLAMASPIPYIAPFAEEYRHRNNSPTWLSHIGGRYNAVDFCYKETNIELWPFFNIDYMNGYLSAYKETAAPLALSVGKLRSKLLQPEFGIGGSFYFPNCSCLSPYLHATASYAFPCRTGGKYVRAHFSGNSGSYFTVQGLYPKDGIFYPTIMAGVDGLGGTLNCSVSYEGAYSRRMWANAFTFEANLRF